MNIIDPQTEMDVKTKRAEMELLKGKQFAIQLQTLIQNPVQDLDPLLYDQLTMQILASFSNTISLLTSCPDQLPDLTAADAGGSSCSGGSVKRVKGRRGCYKRRKSSHSWTTVSKTKEDGLAWRKYGQKKIFNSQNPRCYYRCTYKPQGCKALKQVQKLAEEPFLYQTTYFNNHTCTDTLKAPRGDPDHHVGQNLLSFRQVGTDQLSNPKVNMISQVKEDYSFVMEEGCKQDPWKDMLGGQEYWLAYDDGQVGSGFHSSGSTSYRDGLDVEVDQLDDIDNVQFE